MKKFSKYVVKYRIIILILSIFLLIPSLIGYLNTKVNYDILTYLPSDIETLKGEKILTDDFKEGSFSIVVLDNFEDKEILALEEKFRDIAGVNSVISIVDLKGTNIPYNLIPKDILDKVKNKDSSLMIVTFYNSTSDDLTLDAVSMMRDIIDDNVNIGGMSALTLDTKELFISETLLYVVVAVIFCIIVLEFSLDSYVVPFLLMGNIGMAILYNMGTNIIFTDISYITKAISTVLQLGVTTDFSIFLYHKYENLKKTNNDKNIAMEKAIYETFVSVFGSSITTIAGFLALCTMKLTLGIDIGLVMAKGVIFGVISVLTIFPTLLLVFDKLIDKTMHKEIMPSFNGINNFIMKHYKVIFMIFLILLVPSYLSEKKTNVYYKLDKSIPDSYSYTKASKKLKEDFNMVSEELVLINSNISDYDINLMCQEIENIPGINMVINPNILSSYNISYDMIPIDILNSFKTDKYKLIIISSNYDIATDELNKQIEIINKVIKKYDKDSILAGEGALMDDLVTITDTDFKNVNYTSIFVIFILMIIVLKSFLLPILLVIVIEFAIFINMGIPYFFDTEIPFIASVVIGTIQLGATIDYAILMSTKYLEERKIKDKLTSIRSSLDSSIKSIFVSAMCFFASTIGVGFVSNIDMIGSLCILISRGALISMMVVIMVLPSVLIIFDKYILKTTYIKKGNKSMKKKILLVTLLSILFIPLKINALVKEETVYSVLNNDGSVNKTFVNTHLLNTNREKELIDKTDLIDIKNINSNDKYTLKDKILKFNSNGNDIFYQGNTSKKLPIDTIVSYKLDNKDIKLKDLLGKKGNVTITIKYINNTKEYDNSINDYIYTPFVINTITNINKNNIQNIKVKNMKVIDNGLSYMLIGISSPGLYESLKLEELKELDTIEINYDTTNFSLPQIYIAISNKIINNSDLSVFDKFDDIYNNIYKLKDSITQISNGSSLINDNLNILLNKLVEIKDGSLKLDVGLKEIIKELNNIKDSLNDSKNNKMDLINNLININNNTLNDIDLNLNNLKNNYDKYKLKDIDYNTILNLEIKNKMELYNIKLLYENTYNSNNKLKELIDSNNKVLSSYLETSNSINTLLDKLNMYLNEIENGFNNLSSGLEKVVIGVDTINSKMYELNSSISLFNNEGISKISIETNKIKDLSNKILLLKNKSSNYDSFTLKDNNTKSTTKFISVINSESKKEKKKVILKKEKKKSLIDKIVSLFK